MKPLLYRDLRIGILGGGQLGRMLIQAAVDYHLHIHCLDPAPDAPCQLDAQAFTQGSLTDYDTVMAFGQTVDLLTIEIENVNTAALEALQAQGKTVYPDPKIIRMIQDKRAQKQFYADHGLPTAPFTLVDDRAAVAAAQPTFPIVHKLGREGYDGRGVKVLRKTEDIADTFDKAGLLEEFVPFEKELAIIVARNPSGAVATHDVVEMVFHPEHNLVEYLFAPAQVDSAIESQARGLASRLVEALDFVGLLAVELFLTRDGQLLINEIAPRPHNSGHHTIRACPTSQFEQHLRAILDLPLGDTRLLRPGAMVNILGESGTGSATYPHLEDMLGLEGVFPHIYGKTTTKPARKMGHVTILAEDIPSLRQKVAEVQPLAISRPDPGRG